MAVRARRSLAGAMAGAALALGASSAACSLIFDTDPQCSTTSDCAAKGAAFADTMCVDSVCVSPTSPDASGDAADGSPGDAANDASDADPYACGLLAPPDPDPSKPVTATLTSLDFSAGTPATAIDVRLCASTDALCTNPRTTLAPTDAGGTGSGIDAGPEGGTGWVYPAADGKIVATVETGFEGFFEIRSQTYFPTVRFTSPPLRSAQNDFDEIMLRPEEIQFFADEANGNKPNSYDTTKGLVFTLVRDCNENPIANVKFTTDATDPELFEFYIINTTPTTQQVQTDATGRGGFANVPAGLATFTAYFADTGKPIGSTRALIRAGYNTTVSILPSPTDGQ